VVGQAYHSGVLAAVEHDFGWDPRDAEVIVGTSAGAVTGAALREGVSASGLAAWCVDAPLWGRTAEVAARFGVRPDLARLRAIDMLRPLHLPALPLVARAIRAPWRIRPTTVAMTLLHDGSRDIETDLPLLAALPEQWPAAELWTCAVRRVDGRRITFGRERSPRAGLREAVAASCAVPGYFRPVRIGKHVYLDGGAHSPTNADTLRGRHLDLVIVIAPLSGAHQGFRLESELRRRAGSRMRAEVRTLQARGHRVLVLEPGASVVDVMGRDFMDSAVVRDVVRESFLDAGEQLRAVDPATRSVLTTASSRGHRDHAVTGTR
jgi:NTE family protein